MFEAALGTAIAFIFILLYFPIRKLAGLAWIIDIAIFMFCIYIFKGTYAGMMTGIIAGIVITCFLRFIRGVYGYETPVLRRRIDKLFPTIEWDTSPPEWKK